MSRRETRKKEADTLPRRTAEAAAAGGPDAPAGAPLVAVVMGSTSDWDTMRHADEALTELEVPHECRVVSAHRTPELMRDFAREAAGRGIEVIVAGAGGAAHLPGMIAAQTVVPVLGVPVESRALSGLDSLLSIVQMPAGVPVGTLAIGRAGARNAALLAAQILATRRPTLRARLEAMRQAEERRVRESTLPTAAAPPCGGTE
jgi:5-(carboxyamino)imidazole ribonucleotide mutase